jgi:protein phosphatase
VDDTVLLEINEHTVEAGDLYLMCSDGLSDMVEDDVIAKIVSSDLDLNEKAVQLLEAANANGGKDNISVLMVEASKVAEKRGLIEWLLGR